MSKTIKIIYPCSHIEIAEQKIYTTKTLIRSFDKDYDIIESGAIIYGISSVYQGDVIYLQGYHYVLFAQNRIQWVGDVKPLAGSVYTVGYEIISITNHNYLQENCPRCRGNGWYVNALEELSYRFNKTTGLEKLSQDYTKILLSKKSEGVGTILRDMPGREIRNEEQGKDSIASAVRDAEEQCKLFQLELVSSGASLPEEEKLDRIEIEEILYEEQSQSFYVDIIIVNGVSSAARLSISV